MDFNINAQTLDISNIHQYNKKFHFREPFIVGSFSIDRNRTFRNDDSQMKYLYKYKDGDNLHFDLNVGFETTRYKSNNKSENIDDLLRWVMSNKEKIVQLPGQVGFSLNTDFVCFRGLLTTLFATPYEFRESWILCATKFNNTIYLCQFDTEASLKRNAEMTEKEFRLCSYGFKFEQYMSTSHPGKKPDLTVALDQNEEHCLMFRTRLNTHSIIGGAEVDCLDVGQPDSSTQSRKRTNARDYIELKTSRIITHPRQRNTLQRYKMLKWWAQSYLVGIPRIICGFRDDDGIVQELQTYKTSELPNQAQGWNSTVCVNCCDQLLDFIKRNVTVDDPRAVFKFCYNPGTFVTAIKVPDHDLYKYSFLPEWYQDWMANQISKP